MAKKRPKPAPKGRRLPPFEPTQKQRDQVEALAAYGVPQDQIALFIINPATLVPIAESTLKEKFVAELAQARWKLVARVGQSLAEMATGYPAEYDGNGRVIRAERQAEVAAAIFTMKARAGWQDRVAIEATGEGGGPVKVQHVPAKLKGL